jgi:glutathione S-transferase
MADRAFDRPPLNPSTVGHGDFDTVMSVLADAVSQGDYLLGERFTAADVVVGSAVRYGMMFDIFPKTPEFEAYVSRLTARPALQRSMARDQELAAAQQS